jgi:hypothetical protein
VVHGLLGVAQTFLLVAEFSLGAVPVNGAGLEISADQAGCREIVGGGREFGHGLPARDLAREGLDEEGQQCDQQNVSEQKLPLHFSSLSFKTP